MRASARRAVLTTLTVLVTTAASAKVRESFEKVVPFEPGGTFTIENRNGSIEIGTWSESSVQILAEKTASSESALDDIEIVVEGSGNRVSVDTVHHRKWTFGGEGGGVSYRILLPAEAQVSAETANGGIEVTGIHGRVEVRSVNGSLKVEDIAGEIEAETTNGSIRASYDRAVNGRHRFSTTNGAVRLYLPADAGGEIDAETVNGSIDVDFPVTVTRTSRRHLRGSFGNGSSSFEVSTVNGSVRVLAN